MLKQIGRDGIDEVVDVARELDGWAELVVAASGSEDATEDAWELVAKGLGRAADRLRGVCGCTEGQTDEG